MPSLPRLGRKGSGTKKSRKTTPPQPDLSLAQESAPKSMTPNAGTKNSTKATAPPPTALPPALEPDLNLKPVPTKNTNTNPSKTTAPPPTASLPAHESAPNTASDPNPTPSKKKTRKSSFRKAPPPLSTHQTTPITAHYALNSTILSAFDSLYSKKEYQIAYAVGAQFVETAVLEIPHHGYFYANRHEEERVKSTMEALRVAEQLEEIAAEAPPAVARNGAEGFAETQLRTSKIDKEQWEREAKALADLAREHAEEVSSHSHGAGDGDVVELQGVTGRDIDAVERRGDGTKNDKEERKVDRDNVKLPNPTEALYATALCGWMLSYNDILCPDSSGGKPGDVVIPPEAALDTATDTGTEDAKAATDREGSEQPEVSHSVQEALTPLEETGRAQSDNSSAAEQREESARQPRQQSEMDLERALYLSGLDVKPLRSAAAASDIADANRLQKPASNDVGGIIDIETLIHHNEIEFENLESRDRIRLYFLHTYQGRVSGSTNGCAVIAPLLCVHHFHNNDTVYDHALHGHDDVFAEHLSEGIDNGLSDRAIATVIDMETPAILPEIRSKLGLTKHALIIPSDVHDYFIETSLLSQDQFVGVCGGNVLDEAHLDAMVDLISSDNNSGGKKIAATLFFREHVVCIHKLQRGSRGGKREVWFDLIDSLPNEHTVGRGPELVDEDNWFEGEKVEESLLPQQRRPSERSVLSEGSAVSERQAAVEPVAGGDGSPSANDNDSSWSDELEYHHRVPAVRIRCMDIYSLRAALKWFTTSRFSDSDLDYIRSYEWDDMKSDFDPRVFQAFVWSEA